MFQDSWIEGNIKVTATWREGDNVKDFTPYTQVYGVCFTKDSKVLVIHHKEWIIPGGKPELGEKPIETLKREVEEEASVILGKYKLIGAFEIDYPNNPNEKRGDHYYQLRYVAIIDEILEPSIDPAEGVVLERKFIGADEFNEYVKWGPVGREMFQIAQSWFEKQII